MTAKVRRRLVNDTRRQIGEHGGRRFEIERIHCGMIGDHAGDQRDAHPASSPKILTQLLMPRWKLETLYFSLGECDRVIVQAEADQNAIHTKDILEDSDDGNGTAGTLQNRVALELGLEGLGLRGSSHCFRKFPRPGCRRRGRRMLTLQSFGTCFFTKVLKGLEDLLRVLLSDQPEGELGMGLRRQHGLGASTGVAAPDAVDFRRGPRPDQFQNGLALFAGGI